MASRKNKPPAKRASYGRRNKANNERGPSSESADVSNKVGAANSDVEVDDAANKEEEIMPADAGAKSEVKLPDTVTLPDTEEGKKAIKVTVKTVLNHALDEVSGAAKAGEVDAAVQKAEKAAEYAVQLAVLALKKSKLPQHTPKDEDAAAEFDDFATQAQTTAESVQKAGDKKKLAEKW